MSPERFRELKEAYALGALSVEERREVEEYLEDNPSEQAEIDELSSVASLMALAPEEQEPPARLRKSLMRQVRSESQTSEAGAEAHPRRSEGSLQRLLRPWRLAGTAAAIALAGLLVWNVTLQAEIQDLREFQMSAYELQGSGEASGAQGQVVSVGEDRAMLVAADLPELPDERTYEMWAINNGEPEARGVFEPGDGPTIKTIEETMAGAETFAITVEPEGGSEQPTTDPVVTADLTRSS